MENKREREREREKTSKFARSAISLLDQIMSITWLYIVLVFGAGADWKNARADVSQCMLQRGFLAQQTSPEKENNNLQSNSILEATTNVIERRGPSKRSNQL